MKPLVTHYSHNIWLYRVVFTARYSLCLLTLLIGSMLLAPIEQALAEESLPPPPEAPMQILPPPTTSDAILEIVDDAVTGSTADGEVVIEESLLDEEQPVSEGSELGTATETSSVVDDGVVENVPDKVVPDAAETAPSDGGVPEDDVVVDPTPTVDEETQVSSTSTPQPELVTEDLTAPSIVDETGESATTTVATSTPPEEAIPFFHVNESDAALSFSKEDCTLVHDGSYYCNVRTEPVSERDGFAAFPDEDGDLEIFLVRSGVYYQLTDNTVDDASPYYDAISETVVWHRLVDDRYQIVSYDLNTEEEIQVTSSEVNNMEPSRYDTFTVWQRWGENGYWQIMLSDGSSEFAITETAAHNLAPRVRGHFVIWHTRGEDGEPVLQTYDLLTRTYTTISDDEDAVMSNPRLMMVYEAMYENGDVVTRGFDMVTGKIVPLSTLPQELPDELPNADSTGETRALIQPKPMQKDSDGESEDTDPLPDVSLGTTTDPLTLDLSAGTTTPGTAAGVASTTDPAFDLYILPASSTQTGVEE